MKKKTKTVKKPAKKTAKKSVKKIVTPIVERVAPTVDIVYNLRQLAPRLTQPGAKHFVRVVKHCTPSWISFGTIEELNDYLFEFDQEFCDEDLIDTGSWIDAIVTDVHGELFDAADIELGQDE